MFSKISTYKSTGTSFGETISKAFSAQTKVPDQLLQLKNEIETADAIVIAMPAQDFPLRLA